MNFTGKTLWLTGANGAISQAIARLFFERGAQCVLTDLDEAGVVDFASSLDSSGRKAVGLRQDVTDPGDAVAVARVAQQKFGGVFCTCSSVVVF